MNVNEYDGYYIHKKTGQPLVVYSKIEDEITLLNPNTATFHQLSTKEFDKLTGSDKLQPAKYLLNYTFFPRKGVTMANATVVSNNLADLQSKLKNILTSVSHESLIYRDHQSLIFHSCSITDLWRGKTIFSANGLDELKENLKELEEKLKQESNEKSKSEKKQFTPIPVNLDKAMKTGLSQSDTENIPKKNKFWKMF